MFSLRTLTQRARPVVIAASKAPMVPVMAQRMFSFSVRVAEDRQRSFGRDNYRSRSGRPDADPTNNFVSKDATPVETARAERRVVYVANLPYDARWEDIYRVFGYYGEIERISFPRAGACFLHFVDAASVDKAIQALHESFFHSRRIYVRVPSDEPAPSRTGRSPRVIEGPSDTIYIGNLPYTFTNDELYEKIAPFGQYLEVRIARDENTGLARGFAHVRWPSVEKAQEVIDGMRDATMGDRSIIVNFASTRRGNNNNNNNNNNDMQKQLVEEQQQETSSF